MSKKHYRRGDFACSLIELELITRCARDEAGGPND